jgi:hypothetical protein
LKSPGRFPIVSVRRVAKILSIPSFRVGFELHPQMRFDLFVMFVLNPLSETQTPQLKSAGWFSIFPGRRIAQILSIPKALMDGFRWFLASFAAVRVPKGLASVWSYTLPNRFPLKSPI